MDNIDFQTCTRTIGFWKNHAWPASVSIGGDTIAQCDGSDRREPCTGEKEGILWSAKGKDFSMLCSQLIAAKLNCADGDCTHDGVVSAAEQFLADEGVSCLTESTWQFDSKSQKRVASALASDLDDFNNDFHCVVD